jgi:hypothetical protein
MSDPAENLTPETIAALERMRAEALRRQKNKAIVNRQRSGGKWFMSQARQAAKKPYNPSDRD